MGFYFRKSIGAGPFRVNLSKSGVGYSVGTKGFRTGVSATGRKYTTFGVPGTGMGYRTSKGPLPGKAGGCASMIVLVGAIGFIATTSVWIAARFIT